jgi:hypothetical protein
MKPPPGYRLATAQDREASETVPEGAMIDTAGGFEYAHGVGLPWVPGIDYYLRAEPCSHFTGSLIGVQFWAQDWLHHPIEHNRGRCIMITHGATGTYSGTVKEMRPDETATKIRESFDVMVMAERLKAKLDLIKRIVDE